MVLGGSRIVRELYVGGGVEGEGCMWLVVVEVVEVVV